MQSLRQRKKLKRSGTKDRWGYDKSLSRKVRRGLRRLESRQAYIKQHPYGDQSDKHLRRTPGAIKYH
jgi:hypothetical protein